MTFQKQNVILDVSRIDSKGFWLGNSKEHVAKGTALGVDFTENFYTPSEDGMIGKYNLESDTWSEIKNRALDEFWNEIGQGFAIGTPDGEFPEWAIEEAPPKYDSEIQTVLYKDEAWTVYDIELGRHYWNSDGLELIISDYHFVLPEHHTFTAPPKTNSGFAVRLVADEWQQIEDNRDKIIYDKATGETAVITELGPIDDGCTLLTPLAHSIWQNECWMQQLAPMQVAKCSEVTAWRNAQENAQDSVVTVDETTWDADPNSRTRINNTLQSSIVPPFWTDASNVDQPVTRELLQKICDEVMQLGFSIHARQREMKTEILAFTSCEQVNAYIIAWPQ